MLPRRCLVSAVILVAAIAGSVTNASATEISLSRFSGTETIIDMSELPNSDAINLLPVNWNRTVKSVRFLGGADLGIGGRAPGEVNSSPFKGTPTAGDPAGFQGASLGSWFAMSAPSAYPFSLDFQLLPELPRRVGFLWDQQRDPYQAIQPTLTTQVWFADATSKTYNFAPQSTRLIAFEEEPGIKSIDLLWSPQTPYGTNGPRISLDDVRFEAVPEPGSLVLAGIGLATCAYCLRRERARLALA